MIEIGLGHYLSLGAIIFFLGVIGIFLNRKNVIVILMSIELILLAVNINLISFSIFTGDIVGQIFTMLNTNSCSRRGSHRACNYCCLLQEQGFNKSGRYSWHERVNGIRYIIFAINWFLDWLYRKICLKIFF